MPCAEAPMSMLTSMLFLSVALLMTGIFLWRFYAENKQREDALLVLLRDRRNSTVHELFFVSRNQFTSVVLVRYHLQLLIDKGLAASREKSLNGHPINVPVDPDKTRLYRLTENGRLRAEQLEPSSAR
jgi:hypothetical protein